MRRAVYGQRHPRFHADEAGRFIQINSIPIEHHKRNSVTKCTICWDEYSQRPSPNCTSCINGFLPDIRRKTAYISSTQPYGNFGNSIQTFKVGGTNIRISSYVYMDFLNGRDVEFGDRLVYSLKNGAFNEEIVVMNIQPQIFSGGELGLYLMECASGMDKDVREAIK